MIFPPLFREVDVTQKLKNPQFDSYSAVRTHRHRNGLAMMPTAGLFPMAASAVALHGGTDWDLIAYVAVRRGEPPIVPGPKSMNKNRIFLGGERCGCFPVPDISGIKSYYLSGWLLFGILSPEGMASDFQLGMLPFPGLDQNEVIASSYFSYSLVNQNQTQVLVGVPSQPPLLQGIIDKG